MTDWQRRALHLLAVVRMPVILIALVIVASVIAPEGRFATPENIINVVRQISFEGMIAFGMTLVIVTGGIDLSVGSLVALTGVIGALVMRQIGIETPTTAIVFGLLVSFVVGGLIGAVTGSIIARFAIPAFVVTLSAMLIARGFAFIACRGEPIYELPSELGYLGRGFLFEHSIGRLLPVPVVVLLICYLILAAVLSRTVFGRCVIAVGSNEEAARLAGIPVRRTKLLVYVITGVLCGLSGGMHTGKLMAGDPKVGEMWELNVIAAVVVGGTSLFGGSGSMTGTLIGALIIGVLNNTLNLMHIEHFWQKVVLGCVILMASLADAALRRLEAK